METKHYEMLFKKIDNYFLSHSVGCMPIAITDEINTFYDTWGRVASNAWPDWLTYIERFKREIATLLHAEPEGFCPQVNVSSALCKIIMSLEKIIKNKKIVMTSLDFPSAVFSITQSKPHSSEIVLISDHDKIITLADWEKQLTPDVAVAFISHVFYENNLQQNIKDIVNLCKERGIISIIDIAQSAGITDIPLKTIQPDFVVGSCIKWLCGGPGAGFLYVNPKRVIECTPKDVGWFSHKHPFEFNYENFEYAENAMRYFGGTPSVLPFINAYTSIKVLNQIGIHNIIRHNRDLINQFIDGFKYKNKIFRYAHRESDFAGTISIEINNAPDLVNTLKENRIAVDARDRYLRLSPHLYTTPEEVSFAYEILNSVIHRPQ